MAASASSKNLFLLLALLFAVVALLLSSQVAVAVGSVKPNSLEEVKYGGPGYGNGGNYGGHDGGGNGRGGCHYGCCRWYRYRPGCKRCCGSAHEAPDAEFEDDVKN